MMLFSLAGLLAVLPVVSMKSPIFGPQEVSRVEGSSVSITCYYPDTSVNRHSRKYWCKQGAKGRCTTLISDSYISKDYEGRANITSDPKSNKFVVRIDRLTQNDSGRYKCGLGLVNQGLFFDVSLEVIPGPGLQSGTQFYIAEQGRTVTINCPFTSENAMEKKSVCKKIGESCVLVIDSSGYVSPNYFHRAHLTIQDTSQLAFIFIINRLQLSDTGIYVCQAGDDTRGDQSNVKLQVMKPEPKLLYGDLRGSVSIDCTLDPEVEHQAKVLYLCRVSNGNDCEMIINTQGQRAQAFEGRILIVAKVQGSFSVHINGLRKEDAGSYMCGAHSDGEPQGGWPMQAWQLFVNEETTIPRSPSVVKGVVGGSVAVPCPYNPKDKTISKYWCRWNEQNSCPQLVSSNGLVKGQEAVYEGRLTLHEEPGNGTYTVILNQLTTQDAGFYWCLTGGDIHWWFTVELQIVEGEPDLKVPQKATAWEGQTLTVPCHSPCKYFSYEKYWCKWSNQGCKALPSQDQGSRQASVNCDQNNQLTELVLNKVTTRDEGWYWCGVKEGPRFGETAAVYVEVNRKAKGSQDVSRGNAAPGEAVVEPSVRKIPSKVVPDPSLFAEDRAAKASEDEADKSKAPADSSSSAGQGRSSTVLVSTLVPLALVLALGAMAVAVVRARHRRNVDRVSIGSYRTDISMSDFENSRDFGANDNMGASPVTQETSLGGKDEFMTTTEDTVETEEPKKAKRSSKEEADMAHTAFLLQANSMVTDVQEGPSEA
ncbi:polymeric immunoglobulin receptor [Molossus molossus]|uniref:polymeric immunoglobulin receptor n=1 Tax=Molossus molossus TaxID=27622 RepID=UPI00174788BD|nr:polymeric immunoglobulin receptor [Molossus molossus]KAF6413979.1 polymeric immunoglobulin receptor [Molossus molossus]